MGFTPKGVTLTFSRNSGTWDNRRYFPNSGTSPTSPEQPGESPLDIPRKQDLHRVVDGDDAGDVAFVVDYGQSEQVVLGDDLGDLVRRVVRVGVAEVVTHYLFEFLGGVG